MRYLHACNIKENQNKKFYIIKSHYIKSSSSHVSITMPMYIRYFFKSSNWLESSIMYPIKSFAIIWEMPNALLAKNYKKESSQKSETLFFHIRYFCKILFYLECNKQLAILIKLISWLLTQYPIAHLLSIDKVNKWIFICYSYIYTLKIIEEWLITSKWLRFFVLLRLGIFVKREWN